MLDRRDLAAQSRAVISVPLTSIRGIAAMQSWLQKFVDRQSGRESKQGKLTRKWNRYGGSVDRKTKMHQIT